MTNMIKFIVKRKEKTEDIYVVNPDKVTYVNLYYLNKGGFAWIVEINFEGDDYIEIPVKSREEGEELLNKYFPSLRGGEIYEK